MVSPLELKGISRWAVEDWRLVHQGWHHTVMHRLPWGRQPGLQCACCAADGCQLLGAAMQALWRSSSRLAAPLPWHKSARQRLPVTGTVCMAAAATAGRAALHLLLQTQHQASELLLLRLCLYPSRTLAGPGDCFVVEQLGLVDVGSHILTAAFVPGSAGVLALMHTQACLLTMA